MDELRFVVFRYVTDQMGNGKKVGQLQMLLASESNIKYNYKFQVSMNQPVS